MYKSGKDRRPKAVAFGGGTQNRERALSMQLQTCAFNRQH